MDTLFVQKEQGSLVIVGHGGSGVGGVSIGVWGASFPEKPLGIFWSKNAEFYAFLLRKTTCGQKRTWGLKM